MKKIKCILIALIGMVLISSASIAQDPKVYMRYHVEIYANATPVIMDVQVWKPGQPSTIEDGAQIFLDAGPAQSAHEYTVTGYGASYDIYSVIIYDNSGGNNNAYIGGNYSNTDDFAYKPYSGGTTYIYTATFYPLGAHSAGVTLD